MELQHEHHIEIDLRLNDHAESMHWDVFVEFLVLIANCDRVILIQANNEWEHNEYERWSMTLIISWNCWESDFEVKEKSRICQVIIENIIRKMSILNKSYFNREKEIQEIDDRSIYQTDMLSKTVHQNPLKNNWENLSNSQRFLFSIKFSFIIVSVKTSFSLSHHSILKMKKTKRRFFSKD